MGCCVVLGLAACWCISSYNHALVEQLAVSWATVVTPVTLAKSGSQVQDTESHTSFVVPIKQEGTVSRPVLLLKQRLQQLVQLCTPRLALCIGSGGLEAACVL